MCGFGTMSQSESGWVGWVGWFGSDRITNCQSEASRGKIGLVDRSVDLGQTRLRICQPESG
jgi:hypothetical protein